MWPSRAQVPLPAFNIRRGGSFSAVLEGGELRCRQCGIRLIGSPRIMLLPPLHGPLLLRPWGFKVAATVSEHVAAADGRLCCAATATETGAFGAAMLFDLAVGRMLSPGGGGWPAVIKVCSAPIVVHHGVPHNRQTAQITDSWQGAG